VDSQTVGHVNKIKGGKHIVNFLGLIPQCFGAWCTVVVVDVTVTSLFVEIVSNLSIF